MLTLVMGASGSGKSRFCLDEAAALAKAGKASVLVVPEQVAYTFERELVNRLPGTLGGLCEVKSFKRLCRDLLSECGGAARIRLDEAEKITLVRRAVSVCADKLQYYRRRSKDAAFYGMLARLFDELRNAGADPEKLLQVAAGCDSRLSVQKFTEIAALLQAYEQLLAKNYFDDAGELTFAASVCAQASVLRGKTVFVDGFAGFTAAERQFLAAAMQAADRVVVTLGCSGSPQDYDSAAGMPARTKDRLCAACREQFGIEPQTVYLTEDHRHKTPGTTAAEAYFRAGIKTEQTADGACLIAAGDSYDEAAFAAEEILRLVREEGYRFGDIALTVRDTASYREALLRTFGSFGIPCLFDESETLAAAPATVFLLCVLEMAGGMRTESVLRALKCGIADMQEEEISLLENYAYVHSVDGAAWTQPFTDNPDGFGKPDEAAAARLQQTEQARQKLMEWFSPYLAAGRLRGGALLHAAWGVMERSGAAEGIVRQHAEGRKNAQLAFSMIERLHLLLGDEPLSRDELCDTLRLLAASTKAAQIPPVMDAVLIGGADRSMPFNPRVSFLLGVNDGVFPRDDFDGLLFTLEERDLLYENELILAGSFEECCDMEAWFLYAAAAAPSERVYFSYSAGEAGSSALPPAAELAGFCRAYGITPLQRDTLAGVVNSRTARARWAAAAAKDEKEILAALQQSAAAEDCGRLQLALQREPFVFRDASLAKRLLGREMRLSASKIECYGSCPFRYFVRYMLGVNPLKKVEMTPSEAGNLVHEVMEKLMQFFGGDLAAADLAALKERCLILAEEYMDSRLPREKRSVRMQALADQLGDAVLRLALRLRAEQQQSHFRAADCELAIGKNAEVPAAVYLLQDGSSAVVEGIIDRVDLYEKDGVRYVRVVDYKTGAKEFRLSDIWQGLNIQMLLYLFALKNNVGDRYGGSMTPAGVRYLPSDPKPAESEKDAKKIFRMNGLLLDDAEALAAMEEKGEGVYIPTSLKKDGWDGRNLASAALFGQIERRIGEIVTDMATELRNGNVDAVPAQKGSEPEACRYCDYRAVCSAERVSRVREIKSLDVKKMLLAQQESEEADNG